MATRLLPEQALTPSRSRNSGRSSRRRLPAVLNVRIRATAAAAVSAAVCAADFAAFTSLRRPVTSVRTLSTSARSPSIWSLGVEPESDRNCSAIANHTGAARSTWATLCKMRQRKPRTATGLSGAARNPIEEGTHCP